MTASISAAMNAAISAPTPLRVLYAEDRREDAELCLLELRRSGFQVHADLVETAEEFVEQLRSGSHDLVLADYRLPSWTGIEAFETLKKSGADIPFILVTGTLGEEMAADCIKRGMADYVLKDRLARLPVAVRAALHERTMRREQLRAQQEQREREAVFRLLFASNPLPMAVFDQESLEFLEVNDAAIVQYGYSRDEFMEMRVADLRPTDDVPHMLETLKRLKDPCGPLVYSDELRHRLKDGSIIEVIVNWHSLRFGTRKAILAVTQDISERKRAERALKASEVRFRMLLEAAPDAILGVNGRGEIAFANAAAEELFGYTKAELLGESVETLVPAAQRGLHQQHRSSYHANPHLRSRPMARGLGLSAVRKDGTVFPVEISLSPIGNHDSPMVISIITDITERKRAEEKIQRLAADLEVRVKERTRELASVNQELELRNREVERANQMKSQFLASMSHELRTPLNAILGFSSLLAERTPGPLNEKQSRFVEHIQRGGQHLLQLINDILDLAKIEAGRMELHPENCLIAEILPEVLSLILPLATAKKIRLESAVDGGLAVFADPIRLKQILYNLLSNAVKFTPESGVISVTASSVDGGVELSVRDTGIGIPPGELANIFNEFHQVSASTRGVKEGTGLGLAITKRFVEQHGGRIRVESEPEKGSQFFVLLPAHPSALASADAGAESDAVAESVKSSAPHRRSSPCSPLVLIVDDDPAASELLADYLHPEGYRTAVASSSEEAIALAVEHSPDAITLNMLTPGKTGWHTLSELKSDPRTSAIPVILVSVIDRRKMGFSMGAAEYLLKPVAKDDLLGALRRHLAQPLECQPTVLVVDDAPDDLQMMTELLQASGYAAVPASGGSEALRILNGLRPDAILLDLLMPEVDGFEVIRHIKQNDDLRDLPIFVLTAKQLSEVDVETLRRETRDFFRKGVPWREELLRQVRQSIAGGPKDRVID